MEKPTLIKQENCKKRKVVIFGHFGGNESFYDGQTVKTLTLYNYLIEESGVEVLEKIDTYGGVKNAPTFLFKLVFCLRRTDNLIILPAQNGVRVLIPLLVLINRFYKRKIHYIVIGGWLPELLKKNRKLVSDLKSLFCTYVETSTMKNRLEEMGLKNIEILPNCKKLKILNNCNQLRNQSRPFRICTFSRVMKEKGIGDIVEAINAVNISYNCIVYTLDVYGKIEADYEEPFKVLCEKHSDVVNYRGVVEPHCSVEILKDYFFLAFPTKFYTEGIPGTIIDAYAAGIPVVASRWENYTDLINEGITGYGYEFGNIKELISLLKKIAENPEMIGEIKLNCTKKAVDYTPKNAFALLMEKL